MKDENYYVIHGWMTNKLHLKGTEKEIYAIIYGFTQDSKTEFRGGLEWLSEAVGVSESNIKANINKLVKKGYIIKTEYKGKTNGLRAVAPDMPKREKRQTKKTVNTPSYDIEAFKKSTLHDDLISRKNL